MTLLEEMGLTGPYSKLSVEDRRRYQNEYRKRNAERYRSRAREQYDPVKAAENWKRYSNKNREQLRERQRQAAAARRLLVPKKRKFLTDAERREYRRVYCAKRYNTDPQFKLASRCRVRLNEVLKRQGRQKSKTLKIDKKSLVEWIESKFQPGMTWQNHGSEWHIDHIIPCAEFDLTDPKQVEQCFGYFNLQPLWKRDNLRKNAKVMKQQELAFESATTSR